MIPRLLLALLVSAGGLHADALTEVRANLATLLGKEPLKASLDYKFWNQQGTEKKPKVTQGKANLWIEDDAQGLKVVCARGLLDQMNVENRAKAQNPELEAPTQMALRNMGPSQISRDINAAAYLLAELEDATLAEVRQEAFNGVQARCLILKVNPKISAHEKKYVKELNASGKLWLDADGVPLGAAWEVKLKGRAMLVVTFEHAENSELRFVRLGNRLVTTYRMSSTEDSGGGESTKRTETTQLTCK